MLVREVGLASAWAERSAKRLKLKRERGRMRGAMKTYSQRAKRDPNRAVKNPSWEAAGRRAWMRLWMVTGGKVDVMVWWEALYWYLQAGEERRGAGIFQKWRTAQRSDFAADQGRRGDWQSRAGSQWLAGWLTGWGKLGAAPGGLAERCTVAETVSAVVCCRLAS